MTAHCLVPHFCILHIDGSECMCKVSIELINACDPMIPSDN